MSTMTQDMHTHTPVYLRPTYWGLALIFLGTIVGTGMTMIAPHFTMALNICLVMLGSLIIVDATGEDHQSP